MDINPYMQWKDKNIVLVGLGRSSIAAARLIQSIGAYPFISEQEDSTRLDLWRNKAKEFHIPFETGKHSRTWLEKAHLMIVSPGVPLNAPYVKKAKEMNIPITGELEFAFYFSKSKILAVTGTNGKTTVTSLLATMVQASGRSVALAGNNDTPFSEVVMEAEQTEFVVLEVSSYQLETTDQFHPQVAAVLNISNDHLGRHGTLENYAAIKERIFLKQQPHDAAVVNADDPYTARMMPPAGVQRYEFSLRAPGPRRIYADKQNIYFEDHCVASVSDCRIPGKHNVANALAALMLMHAAGFSWADAVGGLRQFKGVEHRIEFTAHINGVDFYNDSKSTNMDSLRVALDSFDRPVVLIAGGRGKGGDYTCLNDVVAEHVKHLVLLGEDAPKMQEAFRSFVPISRVNSMMEAVEEAFRHAYEGDVVLLSPACASFDMYENFEARGRDFKLCVDSLKRNVKEKELNP